MDYKKSHKIHLLLHKAIDIAVDKLDISRNSAYETLLTTFLIICMDNNISDDTLLQHIAEAYKQIKEHDKLYKEEQALQ